MNGRNGPWLERVVRRCCVFVDRSAGRSGYPSAVDGGRHPELGPVVAVVAPSPLLTVTIEQGTRGDEVHLHAGGQGVWVARMVAALGGRPRLIGVFGGEIGSVVEHLLRDEGIDVRPVPVQGSNGAYVHDRRSGEREELAQVEPAVLTRHDVDEWYTRALVECLDADIATVTGVVVEDVLPVDVFRRLCTDLARNGRRVVADLSGAALHAALEGGVRALKVSHEELIDSGLAKSDDLDDLIDGIGRLAETGLEMAVVSRGPEPTLAWMHGTLYEIRVPPLELVDGRGGGDAMAASMAVGLCEGRPVPELLRLLGAAGALNVTRRGLATSGGNEVERFSAHVEVRRFPDG